MGLDLFYSYDTCGYNNTYAEELGLYGMDNCTCLTTDDVPGLIVSYLSNGTKVYDYIDNNNGTVI